MIFQNYSLERKTYHFLNTLYILYQVLCFIPHWRFNLCILYIYRVTSFPQALEVPNIIILRILGSLNFVNKEKVMKKINKMVAKSSQRYKSKPVVVDNGQPGEIKVLIVDMMAVSSVDSSTVKAFLTLHRTLKAQGVTLKLVQFTGM